MDADLPSWQPSDTDRARASLAKTHFCDRLQVSRGYPNNAEHIRQAFSIALISSDDDRAESCLRAGQLYQRICLTAESEGVAVQPLSQMFALPEYRSRLGEVFGTDSGVTQHFFRMGCAEQTGQKTPHWPLETFVV